VVRGYLQHEDQLYARCVRDCKVAIGRSLILIGKFALRALKYLRWQTAGRCIEERRGRI